MFLQKDSQHQGLIKIRLTAEVLKIIYKAAKSEITSDKISFDQNLFFSIKEAIDKFEEDEEELDFSINLLSLCKTADQYQARAIKAIVYLFPELISVKNRAISEAHLSASFVHPVIRSLFSSPNDISHCSNTPQYDYFDFANFVDCDTQRINLLYTDVMKKALQNAIGENKLTIAKAINIFNERSKQASPFGKEYNAYWKDRDEKEHEERIRERQRTTIEFTNEAACSFFESVVQNIASEIQGFAVANRNNDNRAKSSTNVDANNNKNKDEENSPEMDDISFGAYVIKVYAFSYFKYVHD